MTVPVVVSSFMLNVGLVGGPRHASAGGVVGSAAGGGGSGRSIAINASQQVCVRPDSTAVRTQWPSNLDRIEGSSTRSTSKSSTTAQRPFSTAGDVSRYLTISEALLVSASVP